MKTITRSILLVFISFLFCPNINAQALGKKSIKPTANKEGFIENKGQIIDQNNDINKDVKFLLNQAGLNVQLRSNSFSYDAYTIVALSQSDLLTPKLVNTNVKELSNGRLNVYFHRIDIEFIGANPSPDIVAEKPGNDFLNYYTTGTPEEGVLGVRHFGKVTYKELYPGIDLEFVANSANKPFEYNFIVHPGADISVIKWKYNGAFDSKISQGQIAIYTQHGIINENIPVSFEKESGTKAKIAYRSMGQNLFGFEGKHNSGNTLIIDPLPIFKWATYYGGTVLDEVSGVASDASGNIFVTGETTSSTTIATTGAYQTTYAAGTVQYGWGGDAFIAKMTEDGNRIYGTYFGGTGEDMGWSIEVDPKGDIFVTGDTKSTANIATTGAFQTTMAGTYHDPFLVKFSSAGSRVWGTYFGGTGNDRATRNGMAVDAAGNVYITGTNNTANNSWITTPGCYQSTNLSTSAYDEPFAAKFSTTGTLIWGTYYGGTLHDQGIAIALDKSNNVYLTGNATSTTLIATTGAYQTTLAGGQDAFIAKLNSTGTALLWATYYGGAGTDIGNSIVVDANEDVYISGYTTSTTGIATSGAYLTSYQGGSYDGFLAKFSSTGSRLWGTYTGGSGYDLPRSMAISPSGEILVTGHTDSKSGITTTDGLQTTYIGGTYDGYISKFNNAGKLLLGTYFGGTLEDIPWNIEVDSKSNVLIVGRTTSLGAVSPTGVYQSTFGGGTYDGFIVKFQDLVADLSIENLIINPNPMCSNTGADVIVKTKNYGPIPAQQITIGLDQVGQARITHKVNLNELGVGKDTTFTVQGLFKSNIPGTGVTITGLNLSTDLNSKNDTFKIKMDIQPSPSGSALVKGAKFISPVTTSTGTSTNPDIVAYQDTISYEILEPNGLLNKDYGSKWKVSAIQFVTKGNKILPGSNYLFLGATSSSNGKLYFYPEAIYTDSNISLKVTLQVQSGKFCDSVLTREIFVAPKVQTNFSFDKICDGDNVVFSNLSSISSGNFTSKWDFGTGNPEDTSANTDAIFKFPRFGMFNVKLTTTSAPYGYVTSKSIAVTVNEIPNINFKVFNACFGDSVILVNSTTISKGLITYKWDLGNGSTSIKENPKQKYFAAGSYKVTLTATSNGCSQKLTKNAWVFPRPVAKFTLPSLLCDKTDIPMQNNSTITMGNLGYRWTYSDGGTSTSINPNYAFKKSGSHTIKMKAISEFGCTDSVARTIFLAEAPEANFTYGPVCNQSNTNFNFTGQIPANPIQTSFYWDFGGEGLSNLQNPSKQFANIGKKLITLNLLSNNGCSNKITKEIDVKQQSKADFQANDVCDGQFVTFVNKSIVSSGTMEFKWKFGDGKISSAQSPRHLYPIGQSNSYNITLVALVPGGCSDSITKAISVNYTPSSNFTFSTSGRLVNFISGEKGNAIYHWDFGDGGTAETINAQYHYLNSFEYGKFSACLYVENAAGCYSQTCKEIVISGDVKDVSKNVNFKIHPNPNSGQFTVEVAEPKSDLSIDIFDVLGHNLGSLKGNGFKTNYQLDLNVANGVYIVRVSNGGLVSSNKITVNR
jgi:PKD repeat protein